MSSTVVKPASQVRQCDGSSVQVSQGDWHEDCFEVEELAYGRVGS